jgi:hypothetical protein
VVERQLDIDTVGVQVADGSTVVDDGDAARDLGDLIEVVAGGQDARAARGDRGCNERIVGIIDHQAPARRGRGSGVHRGRGPA